VWRAGRDVEERHPVQEAPPWTLDERVRHLEHELARLWDQVWWQGLPWYRRAFYRLQGFSAPIERFYEDAE
jgi:hypothetical protein